MGSITWRLSEFLAANSIKPYALAKEIGVAEATIYRLAREGKAPERIDLSTLDRLLSGLETILGRPVDLSEILIQASNGLQKSGKMEFKKLSISPGEKPSAFILMPFDPASTQIYNLMIKPALESVGYTVLRADSLLDQQNILKKIIHGIAKAHLIVADLTKDNPNVFYELGLCHGLNISTIMITQSIKDLPFDLKSYLVKQYSRDFAEIGQFIEELKEIAESHKKNQIEFGNPVQDFWPDELVLSYRNEEKQAETSKGIEVEEKGFFEIEADISDIGSILTESIGEMSKRIKEIGDKTAKHSDSINKIKDISSKPGKARAFKILEDSSRDMTDFSEQIDMQSDIFISNLANFTLVYQSLINNYNISEENQKNSMISVKKSLDDFLGIVDEPINSARHMRNTIAELPKITTSFIRARNLAVKSMEKMLSGWEEMRERFNDLSEKINQILVTSQ
jgi:DNA-binding Xre family transcriptional regulator